MLIIICNVTSIKGLLLTAAFAYGAYRDIRTREIPATERNGEKPMKPVSRIASARRRVAAAVVTPTRRCSVFQQFFHIQPPKKLITRYEKIPPALRKGASGSAPRGHQPQIPAAHAAATHGGDQEGQAHGQKYIKDNSVSDFGPPRSC